MDSLPKKIVPDPIVEALVEIRFDPAVPEDAVFGVIYGRLSERFTGYESLPILQLPEFVRRTDQNLAFQPHYRLENEKYVVQIGPRVLSFAAKEPYPGWEVFSNETFDIIGYVKQQKIAKRILRAAVRYTNFFSDDVFSKINLNISLRGREFDREETFVRTIVREGRFRSILQVGNNVTLSQHGRVRKGSIIDVDTFTEETSDFLERPEKVLNEAHEVEKRLFFTLLSENYLESLNPEY